MRKTLLLFAILGLLLISRGGDLFGQQEPAAPEAPAGEVTDFEGDADVLPDEEPTDETHAEEAEHGEQGHGAGHTSPVLPVLLGLVIILLTAKIGGALFERFHQPAVLGELIFGVLLGNLALIGYDGLAWLATDGGIEVLAELGVILLLFEVGLESNIKEMMSVGWSSLAVAILGVVAPFFLGWGVSALMIPDHEMLVHIFIGATLCATSVGITARVLADLGKLQQRESKIILGAAVIDDILGLVILAVVAGVITAANTGDTLSSLSVLWIIGKAVIFLALAIGLGGWIAPRMFRIASKLRTRGMLLIVSLAFCFALAYLANVIELATIVGAFAAGLILDEVHYKDFTDAGEHTIEELLHPISMFLVPIFFVLMGIKVDLSTFGEVSVLGFAALLSVAAIIGKMICALGVLEKGLDKISVAVGMVPRGEVGLIFANIGLALVLHGQAVINSSVYSAVVIMVIITTLITPPALKWTLARGEAKKAARATAAPPAG
jgi:Kef-type K+ transport system membrane component KefB